MPIHQCLCLYRRHFLEPTLIVGIFTTIKQVVKKIFNFVTNLKMPNNAPLTIENFDFEKFRAKAFESKKSRVFT